MENIMSVAESLNTKQNAEILSPLGFFTKAPEFKESHYALMCRHIPKKPVQQFIKRAIEVTGTLIGLVAISPLLLVIVLAIKLDSKGPVLFKQKRVGKNGTTFNMYKFRSMTVGAEDRLDEIKHKNETNHLMFKMKDDPRITSVGKFLRKYSLDEFPQLLNVLTGDMSLVGFRPPLPSEVANYKDWHHLRFLSQPGMTGPWQVSGRSSIKDFDDVVKLEFDYAKKWSLWADLVILFKTIPVVLLGKEIS